VTGRQDWPHGPGAYNLGLEMGQHVDNIAIYQGTNIIKIIARFRVLQLSVAVLDL